MNLEIFTARGFLGSPIIVIARERVCRNPLEVSASYKFRQGVGWSSMIESELPNFAAEHADDFVDW